MGKVTLEICVDTLDDAVTAETAGADRIELCSSLESGGLTPSIGLVRHAVDCDVPVFAMIRPRAGDFYYSDSDLTCMLSDVEILREAGVSGFVFGALNAQNELHVPVLEKLLSACNGMPATLHRAFDHCRDPMQSLDVAIQLGFDRILTSGASATVISGMPLLAQLFARAGERIIIMPGGGVTPITARQLLDNLPVSEIHSSCKSPVATSQNACSDVNVGRVDVGERFCTDAAIVREMQAILGSGPDALH